MGGRGRPKGTGPTKQNKRKQTEKAIEARAANAAARPRPEAPAAAQLTTVSVVYPSRRCGAHRYAVSLIVD